MTTTTLNSIEYQYKWGRIPILNSKNYASWMIAAKAALVTARAYQIVLGTEIYPIGNTQPIILRQYDFVTRQAYTIAIINKSIKN